MAEAEREQRLRQLLDEARNLGVSQELIRLARWAINLLSVTQTRLADTQEALSRTTAASWKAEKLLSEARAVIALQRSEHDSLVAEHADVLDKTVHELANTRTEMSAARRMIQELEREMGGLHEDIPPVDPGGGEA